MNKLSGSLLLLVFVLIQQVHAQPLSPYTSSNMVTEDNYVEIIPEHTEAFIDSLVQNLSLREKIAQLFIIRVYGEFIPYDSREYYELKKLVEDYKVGGLIFMQGDVYGQAILNNKLQKLADIPLWISQDMEFGAAMRISEATRITPAMGLAATGNKRNAYMAGKLTAIEAKALGVHQIFAPVLDVNNNPENPVINVRSFSEDPVIVSEFGKAFINGVRSEQIVATAKHFPGHGDTDVDSHYDLPVVNFDYSRLDSVELIPFRSAIDDGLNSIMSAHIAFENFNNGDLIPATLDTSILSKILLDSLQFNGVVVTDGLEMRGVTSRFSPGEAVVKALQAGADIMLLSPDTYTAIDDVEKAVLSGQLSESRINQSFRKLITWKQIHGLFDSDNQLAIHSLHHKINTQYHKAEANRIARESVTLLRNKDQIIPLTAARFPKILYVAVSDDRSGYTGSTFARMLRNYHPDIDYELYDERSSDKERADIIAKSRQADLIIIGSFINLRYNGSVRLEKELTNFIEKLTNGSQPSMVVSFGNPYIVSEFPEANVHMLAWQNSTEQAEATASAIFGASDIGGTLPISIPEEYSLGDGLKLRSSTLRYGNPEEVDLHTSALFNADEIILDAIRDSVFPGAVLGVVKDGVLAYHQSYGYHDYSKTEKVLPNDVYDVASITKIAATTLAAMHLIDIDSLKLSDLVSQYIPEFSDSLKSEVTIRDLLLHQSGLPPFRVYVDSLQNRKEIIEAIKNEPLTYDPGTKYVYSDLGMILLSVIIEDVTKTSFDRYLRNEFYYPMGMYSAFFNPQKRSSWLVSRIPPTELDTVYNRGRVQGEVHDERAYFMDGIAGHAGLFASVTDLAKFSYLILNDGYYGGERYIDSAIVREFTNPQSELSGRGYGFDRKSMEGYSTAGQFAGEDTFGHLGFTGTSIWMDRENNMSVILLTNRTYPQRSYGKRISEIRRQVADAVYSSMIHK